MADEQVEELPPKEGEEKSAPEKGGGGGGGNPWIPVAILIVLVPIISYALTSFLLVPKITGSIKDAVTTINENKEKAKKEGPHGEGAGQVFTYDFENVIANLAGSLHSRYVKVSFTVEGTELDFVEKIERYKARLIDATLGVLSAIDLMQLEKPEAKNLIRNDLLSAFEVVLNGEVIQHLYFSEFVVQ